MRIKYLFQLKRLFTCVLLENYKMDFSVVLMMIKPVVQLNTNVVSDADNNENKKGM